MTSGSHEAVEEMSHQRKKQCTVPVEEEEEQIFAVRVGECVSIVLTREQSLAGKALALSLPWGGGGLGETRCLATSPP